LKNNVDYLINKNIHYCKACDNSFRVKIHEKETGDFILVCPTCSSPHYRHFNNGQAVHCDINKRKLEPIILKGE